LRKRLRSLTGPSASSTRSESAHLAIAAPTNTPRLRQTDVKSGHYERKVQALEQSRDQWESKYEEMAKKYADTKKELDDFVKEIGNI
jgi:hypothetical protein